MAEQKIELGGIIARLERVERENRRLKRIGVALLLGVSALVLMGQAQAGRTVEAERFILRDQDGKMRAQLSMDPSGTPNLELYDKTGERSAEYRSGDLLISSKEGTTWIAGGELSVRTPEGHIDFQSNPLRLYIREADDKGLGWVSLGMTSSLKHDGEHGPSLTLAGSDQKGFVELNTADGPFLKMEPGLRGGKVLPGGFVEIAADEPRIVVTDQQGFATTMGHSQLEAKKTGKRVNTSAASVVLSGKDSVLWSAP